MPERPAGSRRPRPRPVSPSEAPAPVPTPEIDPLPASPEAPAVPGRSARAPRRRSLAAAGPEPTLERAIAEPEASADSPASPAPVEPGGGLADVLWRSGLLNVLAIAGREIKAYFISPIGWVLTALVILALSAFGYWFPVIVGQQATLQGLFGMIPFLFIFVMPLYTMRLISEESRAGTLEVMLTSPVRDWELVIGKWVGVVAFYMITLAPTLVYGLLLAHDVTLRTDLRILGVTVNAPEIEYGQVVAGYFGALLIGATMAAVGLLCSSVTQNQIIAAAVGVVALLLLWYVGLLAQTAQPPASDIISYIGGQAHARGFTQGQIVLKDVVYFLTIIVATLFVSIRVLESRRWR